MKKSTANIMCLFVDLFAIFAIYILVYQPLKLVFAAIVDHAEFIKYNTNFFIVFGCIAIPILHIIGLIETYLPRHFNRSICTKVFYGSLIIFLLLGIGTGAMVKRALLYHGYVHCVGADKHMKLAHFKVYVRQMDTCRQLTLDKKNHGRAGLK